MFTVIITADIIYLFIIIYYYQYDSYYYIYFFQLNLFFLAKSKCSSFWSKEIVNSVL